MIRRKYARPARCLPDAAPAIAAMSLLLAVGSDSLGARQSWPPEMAETTSEVYRTVGDVELRMYFCKPEGHTADDRRPAIVFFFGGGWRSGSPQQFLPHCRYLAERGMIAAVADYRVASRHGVTADECVKDAKSAVRWLRSNADRLGIDPNRIAAGGGSAGGHLAAATATLPGHDPDPEGPSAAPDALVLFNPATILAPVDGDPPPTEEQRERFEALARRFGAPPESMSPYHHLREGLPPTIMFHGTADETVPQDTAHRFCLGLRKHGARCDFVSYHDQGHGFFNFGRGEGEEKNRWYEETVSSMDGFLYSLEWLDPRPNPDGTPGERLTWRESLSRALGNQRLPEAIDEIRQQLEAEAHDAVSEAAASNEEDDATPENSEESEEDDAPPEGSQAEPDDGG